MKQILTIPVCLLVAALAAVHAGDSAQVPAGARMSYLDNGVAKVGVDLNHGGAIVFLARAGGENVINNFDLGRQVQLSFFSGPVPFGVDGQRPAKHWEHIGWNPIQAGDDFKNPSRLLAHENDGRTLHVKCQPMQWPLNNVPGDCTFDSWLELDGTVVKARARLTDARTDHTQYPARLQELPAVYANAAFHRVVSYQGNKPFTGDTATEAPKPAGPHPWSHWQGTEGWAALLDARDQGLGLITPGHVHFTGGFAGVPGPNDTTGNSTGYPAGQGQEILDHNIVHEFAYELVVPQSDQQPNMPARAATSSAEPLVEELVRAHRFVVGEEPVVGAGHRIGATTDSSHFKGVGIRCVDYGPGFIPNWPMVDERVEVEQLVTATRVLALTTSSLLSQQ